MRRALIWPFRNFGLKVVSLGLAVLLWMVVSGEETVERGLRVPLELQQMPAGLELQSDLPPLVDVRVRGGSGTLSRMATGDITAVIDVHTARPGQRLFQLTPEQVRVPFGVQVMQINPPSVALVFEKTMTKQVKVQPDVQGTPAAGYVEGKVTSDPATVEVTGPASAVESVTEATTEPVSIAGAKEAVNDRVTIGFIDTSLRLTNPRQANVHVDIIASPDQPDRSRPRRGGRE